ncbi:peptide chain release factor N(5)-glutamine methyltransferase [Edwardsiella ictaluri]|uniref:peptide chain release factor N(5)-glutamine methyltransferase n=1 Tax=Edwardsiella ictaluri TaxID=67780 RepID=UPI0018DC72C9|nr:peptide chain release factor N(5)-glutamine methyltransferase [Edwardsiella ictaluri]QPW29812.1 peptide chain release factor N(5)-glutamine methyltransferase [Edwardsiella ictaluri]UYB62935.1 peptide chain release factor N(5)-glutamine methyltransferase [Edwardsiella ictaluri]UYB66161.1 peptide chain release factor N(5)-glutamine methyltransferase [Edwardsiella ictaluri]BEH98668.1 peptide chain release factor N(5)-glutamine methyltransferase [Edwardsiella ictaluri]BEI02161.1 peptide chain r
MRYDQWLRQACARLTPGDSPRRDAEILLEHVTGRGRSFLLAFGETLLTAAQLAQLTSLLARRVQGEPVAYLIGEREFWSLPLAVSPATLIPRPDTECLVEQALLRLPATPVQIVDLGTGTGAIALALASERPDCQVSAVEFNPDAVALAQHNAARLGLSRVEILQGSWFTPLAGRRFTLIVSNPPYIDAADGHLSQGDVRFEPASALVAAEQGLADLRAIARQAPDYLAPGGWLLLEHGWQQGAAVRALLTEYGFCRVESVRDYGNNERVTLGQYCPSC